MKKICVFAALLLLLAALSACSPTAPHTEDEILLTPVSAGQSGFRIIIPRSAGSDEQQAARILRDAIKAACGCELEIGDDYTNENRGILPGELEILVGDTGREESRALSRRLRVGDCAVAVSGGKLLVMGGTQELTLAAAQELAGALSADEDGNLYIRRSQCFTHEGEYDVEEILIDGTDARDYRIVYPAGDSEAEKLVSALRAHLLSAAGIRMSVVSDVKEAEGKEILLGRTNREGAAVKAALDGMAEGESRIISENGSIFIAGYDIYALRYAVNSLLSGALSADAANEGKINAGLGGSVITDNNPLMSVMSFNILCTLNDDPSRADLVVKTVRARMPDSVGFQEVTTQWLDILVRELGDVYDWVGEINDPGGQNWRNAIFYRRDRLELVSTETRWLSATPSKHSKLDSSSQYRIFTLAHFRRIDGGGEYYHVNTHLDYNDAARKPQINVLRNALARLEMPFVVTGDFNFTPSSEYYRLMTAEGVAAAKYLTPDRDDVNTCEVNIIDYCYVSEGDFNVRLYRVEDELICSDHRAVYVELSILS